MRKNSTQARGRLFVGTGQRCAGLEGYSWKAASEGEGVERGVNCLVTSWSCLTCYFSNNLMTFKNF